MKIRVWGARGSHPKALNPNQIRSKISAVIQRARPEDLANAASKEAFLAGLPSWLFGSYSGNTSCVSVELGKKKHILFDAGTGIVEYWTQATASGLSDILSDHYLFFTHYHYDHIQGLPFFPPAYMKKHRLFLHSPLPGLREALERQMAPPLFPVRMDEAMLADIDWNQLAVDESMKLHGADISWIKLQHPGGAYGYKVASSGKTFLYVTDIELTKNYYERNKINTDFFADADIILLDTQYTLDEALQKKDWGHSSYIHGVDFALHWNIKKLVMFHHEPKYDDRKLFANLSAAREYARCSHRKALHIELAQEGLTIEV